MRQSSILFFVFFTLIGCQPQSANDIHSISDDYLMAWAEFYPSRALSAGMAEAAPRLEDFRQPTIDGWIAFNNAVLQRMNNLPVSVALGDRIDRRLLEGQIRRELFSWSELEIHRTDPQTYSGLINHSLTPILVRQNLSDQMRLDAVIRRLGGLRQLCESGRLLLFDGRPSATASSIRNIRSTADFIENNLASALELTADSADFKTVNAAAAETSAVLRDFAEWLETGLNVTLGDAYGEEIYAPRLALAYGDHMTPEALEQSASEEIERVRGLMEELARISWTENHDEPLPTDFDQLVRPMLTEMEIRNAGNQERFLQEFLDLIDRSQQFLRDNDLVDLPEKQTLFTALSPSHFAGAAVGGVYSAGPFDPEAETLFYLPTVSDTAPDEARDGFYRSFNHFFNTMIITHEIYPGHYLQLKAAAGHRSRIRPLFAGDDFTEGWASFCEQMTLDAGWDGDRPLTRMAHLRKRLENAVRAYVSVQVHCRGWNRAQLHEFAVETGLLPPQFAENLWHRAVLTPIQLPSYFIGFHAFDEASRNEQQRLGETFSAKDFNNAVIACGGVPLGFLNEVVSSR